MKKEKPVSWVTYPDISNVERGDVVRSKTDDDLLDHAFNTCIVIGLTIHEYRDAYGSTSSETYVTLARPHAKADGFYNSKQPWLAAEIYDVELTRFVREFEVHLRGSTRHSDVDNRGGRYVEDRSLYKRYEEAS